MCRFPKNDEDNVRRLAMKNKKKTMIITAIGLVVMLAVIVAAVVMRQSGQNTAKESDRSEQTATDPTSVDDNMPSEG